MYREFTYIFLSRNLNKQCIEHQLYRNITKMNEFETNCNVTALHKSSNNYHL